MDIYYWKNNRGNFGDELNPWFWKNALPTLCEPTGPRELICGIGTILNGRIPSGIKVHVLGSGAGYGSVNELKEKDLSFHFVRGPKTAGLFGERMRWITDPALLVADYFPGSRKEPGKTGFVPHWGIESDWLKKAVEAAGLYYISPTQDFQLIFERFLHVKE